MKRIGLVLLVLTFAFCFNNYIQAQKLSYKPGGGVKLSAENNDWSLRLLGYIQSTYTYHQRLENNAVQNSFFVRRARLDFIFDYLDKYQIFFELDGRGKRTELVLAQVDVDYYSGNKIRVGKYITPFSPENYRSSRSLSTVERYSGLNSLFLIPGLDTQYGLMFFGEFDKWEYYLSITNGNGKASDNIKENNNAKDFQGRLVYKFSDDFKIGGSVNFSKEEPQKLSLVDHTFESFNTANIVGKRLGFLGDFEFIHNKFLLRGESFQYSFAKSTSPSSQVKTFLGGYLELGYFLAGNTSHGLQLIGRVETARYAEHDASLLGPDVLNTFLIGTNIYQHGIFRLQVNLVYEKANRASLLPGRFAGKEDELELLTMLQLKF